MEGWLALVLIIGGLAVVAYVVLKVFGEAERKLGRGLTAIEGILIGLSMPYSGAYVLLVMPEPEDNGGDRNG